MDATENYLRRIAKENSCRGVLYEPRLLFDDVVFAAAGADVVRADANVFFNGEDRPIRITHILAAMGVGETLSPDPTPVQGDPRLIQRFGLRIQSHDTYYRHPDFIPLPLLHNVRSAAAPIASPGVSTWRFPYPVVLAQRDAFDVTVQLNQIQTNENGAPLPRRVAVTFDGLGMLSRRPVQLSAQMELSDTDEDAFDIGDLRSDGGEPVEIYQMNLWCGPNSADNDGAGDIRQMSIGVRQVGNSTHQRWQVGPVVGGVSQSLAPATLWGPSVGRAIVHELPVDPEHPEAAGWTFQPGQGVTIDVKTFDATRLETVSDTVWLGLAGYAIVT